jgi:FdhE protein
VLHHIWQLRATRPHNFVQMPAAPSPPQTLLDLLDRRLGVLRATRPKLEDLLAQQEAIVTAQLTSPRPPEVRPFALPRQHLAARIQAGVPLLHDQPIALDIHFAADLFRRLVNALARLATDAAASSSFALLIDAATSGVLDPEQLFGEAFVGHADHLGQIGTAADVAPDQLTRIATESVAPILRACAARLQPLLAQVAGDGAPWERGYCPVCGGWPLLAELSMDARPTAEQQPSLRCGACGSSWRHRAGTCPFCGMSDDRALETLTVEGEPRFHLLVCRACAKFLKVAQTLDPAPPELLALDDLASLRLDVAAGECGYRRPVGSGYRIELAMPDDEWMGELA